METMKRIGTFVLSDEYLTLDSEVAKAVMAKVVVVRAEYLYARRGVEYTALCDDFDEVPPYLEPPRYLVLAWRSPGPDGWSARDTFVHFDRVQP